MKDIPYYKDQRDMITEHRSETPVSLGSIAKKTPGEQDQRLPYAIKDIWPVGYLATGRINEIYRL